MSRITPVIHEALLCKREMAFRSGGISGPLTNPIAGVLQISHVFGPIQATIRSASPRLWRRTTCSLRNASSAYVCPSSSLNSTS